MVKKLSSSGEVFNSREANSSDKDTIQALKYKIQSFLTFHLKIFFPEGFNSKLLKFDVLTDDLIEHGGFSINLKPQKGCVKYLGEFLDYIKESSMPGFDIHIMKGCISQYSSFKLKILFIKKGTLGKAYSEVENVSIAISDNTDSICK